MDQLSMDLWGSVYSKQANLLVALGLLRPCLLHAALLDGLDLLGTKLINHPLHGVHPIPHSSTRRTSVKARGLQATASQVDNSPDDPPTGVLSRVRRRVCAPSIRAAGVRYPAGAAAPRHGAGALHDQQGCGVRGRGGGQGRVFCADGSGCFKGGSCCARD